MGLFNWGQSEKKNELTIKNEQEAWIAIMYLVTTSDGELGDSETDQLSRIFVLKTIFRGMDCIEVVKKAIKLKNEIGVNSLIDLSAPLISEENKAPLLATILDLAMADGILESAEKKIVETIIEKVGLNLEVANKIIEVMGYKNKYNVITD